MTSLTATGTSNVSLATIALPGTLISGVTTIASGVSITAQSLTLASSAATLVAEGTLNLAGTPDLLLLGMGTLDLFGGTIASGTINASTGKAVISGGALVNDTWIGPLNDGTLNSGTAAGGLLSIFDTLTVKNASGTGPGTINLAGYNDHLYFLTVANEGNVVINFGDGTGSDDQLSFYGATTTLANSATVNSQQASGTTTSYIYGTGLVNDGTLNAGTGYLQDFISTFSNAGVINIGTSGTHAELDVAGTVFVNTGIIDVGLGGTLVIGGSNSSISLGTVDVTGGVLVAEGSVISLSSLSHVTLGSSGTVQGMLNLSFTTLALGGGTLSGFGGGVKQYNSDVISGGVINGAAVTLGTNDVLSNDTIAGTFAATNITVANNLVTKAITGTGLGALNIGSLLYLGGGATLNNAVLTLGALGAASSTAYIDVLGSGTATLGTGTTLGLTNNTAGAYGIIEGATLENDGTINIGAGQHFYDLAKSFDNTGVINVTGGELALEGTSFANVGVIKVGAGAELVIGTLGNLGSIALSGGTLVLNEAVSAADLAHVTLGTSGSLLSMLQLNNASLSLAGGIFSGYGAGNLILGNVTLANGTVNATATNISLASYGTQILVADSWVGALNINSYDTVDVSGGLTVRNGALGGPGTVDLRGYGSTLNMLDSETLSNDAITLGYGGGYVGDLINFAGTAALVLGTGTTLTNDGWTTNAWNGFLNAISGFSLVNAGVINAETGVLDVNTTSFSNTGTIIVGSGAALRTEATFISSGAITLASGLVLGAGLNLSTSTAKLVGSGVVEEVVTNAGTIQAYGSLDLTSHISGSGVLLINAGSTLDLGGSTPETVIFGSTGSTLKLDAPTLTVGTLSNFVVGDALDIGQATIVATALSGTHLLATLSTGAVLTETLASTISNAYISLSLDGRGGTSLLLTAGQFIETLGTSGLDKLTALTSGETLNGGAGIGTLVGYAGFGDTFSGTESGLYHETLLNFGGSDAIDITNLSASVAGLTYSGNSVSGTLSLYSGAVLVDTLTLSSGTSLTAGFHRASDGHGGSLITLL